MDAGVESDLAEVHRLLALTHSALVRDHLHTLLNELIQVRSVRTDVSLAVVFALMAGPVGEASEKLGYAFRGVPIITPWTMRASSVRYL